MESKAKYFDEIITNGALFKSLKLFKSPTAHYLCCTSARDLYLYVLPCLYFQNPPDDRTPPQCEVLKAEDDIVEIFWHEREIFLVDKAGRFYVLHQSTIATSESVHFEESDIFEDSNRDDLKWQLVEKGRVECKKVIGASSLPDGRVAILLNSGDQLYLKVFMINPFHEVNSVVVDDITGQRGIVLNVSPKRVGAEFLKHWCFIESLEDYTSIEDILFVFCDGLVYLTAFSEKRPFSAVCIYETVPGVIYLHWSEGASNGMDCLKLVLSVGSVISVWPLEEDVDYLPLSNVSAVVYRSANTIFATNRDCCYKIELGENPVYVKFPHRGLVSFCCVPESPNVILASTLHKSVYWIDIDSQCQGGDFLLPEKEALDNLERAVSRLDQLHDEIEKEDDFQKALSLVMREQAVTKRLSFTAKIVQILGHQHVFRLKAVIDLPGAVFLKSVWKVTASLTVGSQGTHSQTFSLAHDVTSECPFVQFVKFNLNKYEDGMKLLLWFFCCDRSQEDFFCLSCGKFDLDATFFMHPLTSVPVDEVGFQPGSGCKEDGNLCTLLIKLSLSSLALDSVLSHVLANSRALWRSGEWNDTVTGHETSVVIFGNIIKLKVKEDEGGILEIIGNDVEICHGVKIAVIKSLPWNSNVSLNHNLLASIERLHHSLEVLQLEPEENVDKLTELYAALRSETSNLIL